MSTVTVVFDWSSDGEVKNHYRLTLGWDSEDIQGRLGYPDIPAISFPVDELRAVQSDENAYSSILSEAVFDSPALREALAGLVARADEGDDAALNILIRPDQTCLELHSVRWELLRLRPDASYLAQRRLTSLVRFVDVPEQIRFPDVGKPKGDLRALTFVANPTNLSEYDLGNGPLNDIDAESLRAAIRMSSNEMQFEEVIECGRGTFENLIQHLHGGYDVLVLVSHGSVFQGQAKLLLEDWTGKVSGVLVSELVKAFETLKQKPALVMLACCHTAGDGKLVDPENQLSLGFLGPQLAARGVPCVLAMQGEISQETTVQFFSSFADELQRHGNVYQAVSVARADVSKRPDWWCPALISSSRKGTIWRSGFARNAHNRDWNAVINSINLGFGTPIIGPGLIEHITGPRRDLIRKLAKAVDFPLAPHSREELPQVMQYLTVCEDSTTAITKYLDFLDSVIGQRFAHLGIPWDVDELAPNLKLLRRISQLGRVFRSDERRRAKDPHWLLANMDFKVYITTNPDNLLCDALEEADKTPSKRILDWTVDGDMAYAHDEPEPTPKTPIVYYLLGHLEDIESLVLSEDDYFRFLSRADSSFLAMPTYVQRAVTDSSLLLLGYQTDGWDYRVLLNSFLSKERQVRDGRRGRKYTKVGVQLDPTMGRTINPEDARSYLRGYFLEKAEIRIYWDNPIQFVQKLYSDCTP